MSATAGKPSKPHLWKKRLLVVYFILLLLSTIVRFTLSDEGELLPNQQRVTVPEYDRDISTDATVKIAFRDLPALNGNPDAPVVVLIHGSPVGSRALDAFIPELNETCRLIVPDLPGFGGSTIPIADYSARAGARYTLELLDALGIERAFFAAYSMGGGVILNVAEIAPQRVEGLIMGSAIGFQERELLGNYALNHGLHGVQLGLLWLLQNFTPHFGVMDHGIFNIAYARNFYDTDQRPLREIIESYRGPMLFIHGKEDTLVPALAAAEHAQASHQPELVWVEGGHLVMLREPARFAVPILDFIYRVDKGSFKPQNIEPEDIPESVKEPGYGLLFFLLVVGTQVSEDLTCILGGLLASQGVVPLWAAIAACALGIFLGDMLLYFLGYWFGEPALKRAPLKWLVTERSIKHIGHWFHRRGGMLIIISRFIPGTRIPTFVGAGVLRMPLKKFVFFFLVAVLAWTPVLVGASYAAGEVVLRWVERYDTIAIYILIGLIFTMWFLFHQVLPLLTWRGRRMALSRWRRLTCWEYWPLWVVYIPIGLYITWHGFMKYRCPPLFTAVNPGIPNGGGLALESKKVILKGLAGAGKAVAAWTILQHDITLDDKLAELDAFMAKEALSFPLVLKPDLGERGQGVAIVKDRREAAGYLERALGDTIAQAYIHGLEFGVFYYRIPGEARGHILGITDKRFPKLTGDGENTLERLILMDDRTVGMATFFLDKFEDRLDDIPTKGEIIKVTELGTHCRGSLFLDGSPLATPELLDALDAISTHFEGFYFGRYDIRVPSVDDFQAGRHLSVIELNGVSSEATWIYDPEYSYFYGLKTLARQWRIAFQIADLNVKAGHSHLTALEVFRLFFSLRARERFEV